MTKISEEIIRHGAAAQRLKEDSDFKFIMDTVRLQAYKAWVTSQPTDVATREAQYNLMRAVDAIQENLDALISGATVEKDKIERAEKKAEAEKRLAEEHDL